MVTCSRYGRRSPVADYSLRREMSISHADFHRLLPAAVPGYRITGSSTAIRVEQDDSGRLLDIVLSPQRQRRLGMLTLPVTDVELCFGGFDEASLQAFLRRFDLAFQRGGG